MAKKKDLNDIDINDVFKDLDKEFTQNDTPTTRVKTDLLSFDIVLGGKGVPLGKTIEIASESGVGKSTLLLHTSRNLCRQGYRVLWIDAEHATDDEFLAKMGLTEYVESGMFKIYREDTFAAIEKILDTLLPTGQIPFVVIDSLANITSESKILSTVYNKDAKSIDNLQVAGDARFQTLFMKKYKSMSSRYNTTIFFVNQIRQFIPTGYGQIAKAVHSGAKAVKYNMDCIIDLISAGKIKGKKKTINGEEEIDVGSNVLFYIKEKSRIFTGGVKVPGAIYFGQGFSNISTLKILMEMKKVPYNNKMIKMLGQSGSKYTLTFNNQQISCIGQVELRKLIGEHYNELITEFGAEDFNVVKEDFDEAIAIHIDEDPTKDMEDDVVVYNETVSEPDEDDLEETNIILDDQEESEE